MTLRDLKFKVAAIEAAGLASQPRPWSAAARLACMSACPAVPPVMATGPDPHRIHVAQGLPFLPFEEFGERQGSQDGKVHGSLYVSRMGVDAGQRGIGAAGGSASKDAKGRLDVADRVVERRGRRGDRRAGGGAEYRSANRSRSIGRGLRAFRSGPRRRARNLG